MSISFLVFSLVLAIALIMILIIKIKLNPAIALVLGALLLGAMSGLSLMETIDGINNGFGSMLGSIGFPIGFGIILGQMVSDSGGANVIAERLVTLFPPKYALYAVAFAAFVLSIPVFFDVTFVILIPIGIALMKKINKSIAHIVGVISIGAGVAHTLVPPTPNPLAAASKEYFNFDLGIMIAMGIVIGFFMVMVAVTIYIKILEKGIWNKDKDETGQGPSVMEMAVPDKAPSFGVAMIPILLPVALILMNTILDMVMKETPVIIHFIGTKTMSLLLGALAAYVIAVRTIGMKETERSATEALKSAGIVFLITGAGGSLSKIISLAGVNDAIVTLIGGLSSNVFVVLLIGYILGLIFRQITGSGTTASLTSMSIMTGVAATVAVHPVFIALACLDGALFGSTINDSGFWIVSNMSGFQVTGGAKTYTLGQAIASVVGIVIIVTTAMLSTVIF